VFGSKFFYVRAKYKLKPTFRGQKQHFKQFEIIYWRFPQNRVKSFLPGSSSFHYTQDCYGFLTGSCLLLKTECTTISLSSIV